MASGPTPGCPRRGIDRAELRLGDVDSPQIILFTHGGQWPLGVVGPFRDLGDVPSVLVGRRQQWLALAAAVHVLLGAAEVRAAG